MGDIEVKNLTFTYSQGVNPTLRSVNFSADLGQILLITGSNGSGKSTLLACLSGIIPMLTPGKLEGEILWDVNRGIHNDIPNIGVLLQDSDVYLFEEVYEEFAFILQNAGISGADLDLRIREIAAELGLSDLLGRKLRSLSGGERQKVAIGAALICDAPILLLDEPVEQLDPTSALNLFRMLKILAEKGKLIIVCMHNPSVAVPWVDRLFCLRNGQMFEESLKERPLPFQYNQGISEGLKFFLDNDDQKKVLSVNRGPVLEVENLTYCYDNQKGIADLTLQVNQQEVLAVIGPNGSGKSTLVKHFIGLLRPQAGKVFVNGLDIEKVPTWELAEQVGVLFQNPDDQIFNATVFEEIAWSLVARGVPKREALAESRELAKEFDLHQLGEKHPHDLSRSLRQLVALVSVLITKPKILILDEPTKMMDYDHLTKVMRWILNYRDQGGTIVLVTHDMDLTRNYSQRAVVLVNGHLERIGRTDEILIL
ncbi:ATPase component of various ABC-type transport systems with duplicated ATPase domain [Desulfosporosinus orientis DSM 765]|uniref:ATPase component of various ABC-type transport systems with duplicated ATPase domain n=1 Tax=Desulfosporosinus orientis (strain ATCC 19365 / DSM 765 / NCIMB 8382 / VKM B-1628 / Singapore I) TaxID=768706 RepID=G7W7L5_DESOD|nr:ABC transporter ATP-binding protein [Desulfosporosinus orientis]AET65934.1 ATPase component of various ABC-type transport systems with duplicated ATPase domain [Desulfosporosinus orientis DSM 765]